MLCEGLKAGRTGNGTGVVDFEELSLVKPLPALTVENIFGSVRCCRLVAVRGNGGKGTGVTFEMQASPRYDQFSALTRQQWASTRHCCLKVGKTQHKP